MEKGTWYLYDNTSEETLLISKWPNKDIKCPDCDKPLIFVNYKAECPICKEIFKSGWGNYYRVKPVGTHNKTKGRGWASIRPYKK